MSFLLPTVTMVVAAALYQIGVFDRPVFEEVSFEPTLYLILASTNTKDIGGNIERLMKGTLHAIEDIAKDNMAQAATAYGAPEGAERLGVGLYFDDPMKTNHPRWGLGWAIRVNDEGELQKLFLQISEVWRLEEPFRTVKVDGGTKVLRGRIPWRVALTPAIAPMLHWSRGFRAYTEGGYTSYSGRKEEEGSVACEVYVTGKYDSMEYIDYNILMGDTSKIFDSMFPENSDVGGKDSSAEDTSAM